MARQRPSRKMAIRALARRGLPACAPASRIVVDAATAGRWRPAESWVVDDAVSVVVAVVADVVQVDVVIIVYRQRAED